MIRKSHMHDEQKYIAGGSTPETWDRLADDYDRQRERNSIYSACTSYAVTAVSKPDRGGFALDAGCGTGMTTLPLASHFAGVVALDFSRESLKMLMAKVGCTAVFPVQADVRQLPFRNGTFDAVLCANTLSHLKPGVPQKSAVSELIRVAKPRARIVASVHHYSRSKQRSGWIKEGKPGQAGVDYVFRFHPEELKSLFPTANILSVGYHRLNRVPFLGVRVQNLVARWFGSFLARWGFGHMLVVVLNRYR
jgi:SAM-dependent methyltransferase